MANNKYPANLEMRVLQFIQRQELIKAGQKILVAVSGGPDSVCLLQILHRLQKDLGIELQVAHLNHQLRGAESENEERYVADLSCKMNLPAVIGKRDVAGYQAEHKISLEEAAREVRYSFLAEVAAKSGIDRIAVGHTRDDQVETILLHIIRGTGTRGLRGLQPCHTLQFSGHKVTVIRPLLEVRKKETSAYCSGLQLSPCFDSSNLSLSLLRNRVRSELLPLLQTYNSGIHESLLRIRRIAEDDLNFLESEADKFWLEMVAEKGDTLIFDKVGLKRIHRAVQRHLLRRAIEKKLGTLKDIETRHIEEILEALDKPAGRQISLPQGLIFGIEYDRYWLGKHPEGLIPFPNLKGDYKINVPGQTEIPGWSIETAIKTPEAILSEEESLDDWRNDGFKALLDRDKTGNNIKIRARQPGDCFQPLGLKQFKKVGEFMVDARIPRAWRDRIPILYSPEKIIWVAGWRIDDRVKVTENTRQVLSLKMVQKHLP